MTRGLAIVALCLLATGCGKMFGVGGKPDPLRQLQVINARVNAARGYGSALKSTDPDFGGDGKYDCEDYAAAKKFAPDWPVDDKGNAIPTQDYNVTLPDGQLHRVLVVPYQGKNYVMDNYSGNALLTMDDWQKGGWKFEPYNPPKLGAKMFGAK